MNHLPRIAIPDVKKSWARWQFVSQGAMPAEHLFYIHLALEAGCRWIQLRLKEVDEPDIIRTGNAVAQLCRAYNARFILNDYPHLVKMVHAQGVHLGLEDQPVAAARQLLGRDYLIGGTANTGGDVLARVAEEVDYIGLGPYRFTRTKKKLSPVLGLEGYRRILGEDKERRVVPCPVYAIGGIIPEDLPLLMGTAINGVAISGWLTRLVDLTALQVSRRSLTLDNVIDQYHQWKIRYPDAVPHVSGQVKILDALLHENSV
ncbi:thiamine phosphate synthase [Arachidicoccus terrestris]|uniref:thiamine phosphate synthase n=1 Tax=Arachidicoccus terrestris TaxID=2875539 RepID=UPI001CC69626|nr:thiamine phosphate synthase [Arachidicoccus terrestris]UAY55890.1 thiamine phosphate synthase [Arachidicoccus terrestris]